MKETPFTQSLRRYVTENGGGSYKLGASMFLAQGIPDVLYFYKEKTFLIESKVYPNTASPLQLEQIHRIRKWGGYAWIATWKDGIIIIDGQNFESIETMFNFIIKEMNAST
jgi:hypothetical protein